MLLYGKPIADQMKQDQRRRVEGARVTPVLAAVQAGGDLASMTYIKMKQRYGEAIGAKVEHCKSGADVASLTGLVKSLNDDSRVNGILVQLPLPDKSVTDEVLAAIFPEKDVDGLGPEAKFSSATAMAVLKLLEGNRVSLADKHVVLVGRGQLVGRPLAKLLAGKARNLSVCDQNTPDLADKTRSADVLISATGAGRIITRDMVKDGAVLVDVGTGESEGALVGDIDPALQHDDTITVTPTEGGVGPLTVSVLFEHLLQAAGI